MPAFSGLFAPYWRSDARGAGLAVGFWDDPDDLLANWQGKRWTPQWSQDQRAAGYAGWQKAVTRTLDWVDVE